MGSWVGNETGLVDAYVLQQLAAKATALNAISAGLSGRIYADLAPAGTAYPAIVYQTLSPPRDVRGVGSHRLMVDTIYVVKAIAQCDSYAPLGPVAKVIDEAMTAPEGSAISGGLVLASVRDSAFQMVETTEGTQYRYLGGQYRIQAQG